MKLKHLSGMDAGEAWALRPDAFDVLRERLESLDIEAVEARKGEPALDESDMTVRDGVATIPVRGHIARYGQWWHQLVGGVTSLESFALDFQAALDDPSVHALILDIDSPGGQAAGNSEMSSRIFAARGTKPIVAYVGGQACSAAYHIASAADEVVCSPSAMLGSIGAVLTLDARPARDGFVQIVSSQSPRKAPDPSTQEGRSVYQELVDAIAQVFIDDVARNRSVKPDDVIDGFGAGGVKVGQHAVDAGMADRVGDYESLVKHMSKRPAMHGSTTYKLTAGTTPAEPEDSSAMKTKIGALFAGLTALFSSENAPKSLEDEIDVNAVLGAAGSTETPAPAPAPAPAAPGVDIEALADKRASEKLAAVMAKRFLADAEGVFASLLGSGKVKPADRDGFIAEYLDAATLDEASPIRVGDAVRSRLSRVTAAFGDKPASVLAETKIPADADEATVQRLLSGYRLLPSANASADDADAAAKAKQVHALLASTHEGRSALAEVAKR